MSLPRQALAAYPPRSASRSLNALPWQEMGKVSAPLEALSEAYHPMSELRAFALQCLVGVRPTRVCSQICDL
jgi:hypothetical protein